MFRGTHVSPARSLSENWQRGITPKILMQELWIISMALTHLSSIHIWSFVSIASVELGLFHLDRKRGNWQRGIPTHNFMPELWIFCMSLDPLKLYPHMKFHFKSISWTWVIAFGLKKCDWTEKSATYGQTNRQTDKQTDDGEVIPKCHLCLQQVTQKKVLGKIKDL